nr:T9SS type A sorting domain-containing protein [Paludibacter sp.]
NWELFKVSPSTSVSTLKSDSKLNAFVQNGRVVANFEANADGVAELVLYNIQGVELAKVSTNVAKGQNQYTFNAELPAGVYVIRMSENNITTTVKVVK